MPGPSLVGQDNGNGRPTSRIPRKSPSCPRSIRPTGVDSGAGPRCNGPVTVPEAMQDPRLRRFRLRRHRLHCAGGNLSVVAPARGDDLLEGDAALECLRRGQMPYWAEIWPASVGLARQLMRGPDLTGTRALDLGCGIGIAGLAAATKGAEVTFADLSDDALNFAMFNARGIDCQRLHRWQFDWFDTTVSGTFDMLLLADVVYEERSFDPVRRHLRQCLGTTGVGLIADPFREATDDFLEWLQPEFSVNTSRIDTSFGGDKSELRLATICRAET